MNIRLLVLTIVLVLVTSGCVTPPEEAPTPTATITSLPSPTVVWFPPTPTNAPFPTLEVTPTPEMLTGIGELAFQDDFSEASLWQSLKRPSGQVVISSPELAISLSAESPLRSRQSVPAQSEHRACCLAFRSCRIGPPRLMCCLARLRPSCWEYLQAGMSCAFSWMMPTNSALLMMPSPAAGWGSLPAPQAIHPFR